MMNLMLHEICVRQSSNPLPVDAGVSRWGLSEGQGCALQPSPRIDKQKGIRVAGFLTDYFNP